MEKETSSYVARPRMKPAQTLRGKLNQWDNGYCEFVPQGQRESQRRMLKQFGDSSFYKTEGKRDSSYSLHLNVDGQSEDPVADMRELFEQLTKDQRKQAPQMPESSTGRMLLDTPALKIWLDANQGEVHIMACLQCDPAIERQLLQLQGDMARAIGRYRNLIINNKIKDLS